MTCKLIKSQSELASVLAALMRQREVPRLYHKGVIDVSEFILAKFASHSEISRVELMGEFGSLNGVCSCCGRGEHTPLGALFSQLADENERQPYNVGLVEFTSGVLEGLTTVPVIPPLLAIYTAVEALDPDEEYFGIAETGRKARLVTTARGQRELGIRVAVGIPPFS